MLACGCDDEKRRLVFIYQAMAVAYRPRGHLPPMRLFTLPVPPTEMPFSLREIASIVGRLAHIRDVGLNDVLAADHAAGHPAPEWDRLALAMVCLAASSTSSR